MAVNITTAGTTLTVVGRRVQMWAGEAQMVQAMREHQERYDAAHLAWVASPVGAPETAELCSVKNHVLAGAMRVGVRVGTSHLPR